MTGEFWVVAKTKAQRERWAAENVARQGFSYYMPLTAPPKKPTTLRNKFPKPQCLFPRYLFVQTDGRWRFLLGTFGVMGLVMQGERPAVMPTHEIESMKAREENGLIVLQQPAEHKFHPGDKVRINSGAFSGYVGMYDLDPSARVRVLLDLLGRKTRVEIDDDCLEAANG